jgi:hypothetical protein
LHACNMYYVHIDACSEFLYAFQSSRGETFDQVINDFLMLHTEIILALRLVY